MLMFSWYIFTLFTLGFTCFAFQTQNASEADGKVLQVTTLVAVLMKTAISLKTREVNLLVALGRNWENLYRLKWQAMSQSPF